MRELKIGNATLIQGDGFEWVKKVRPKFILTDPPISFLEPLSYFCQDHRLTRIIMWSDDWLTEGRKHPGQKDVEPFYKVICQFPEYPVVVDPFMGSGTTGVAAIMAGRRFIGVEKKESWFDLAASRIRDAVENTAASEDVA